jgi:hypothetical protein
MEITGEDIVEEATLVIQAAVVGNPSIRRPTGRVKFVSNDETANSPFFQDRKGSKEEDSYCP